MPGKTSRRKRRQQESQGRVQTKTIPAGKTSSRQKISPVAKPSSLDRPTGDPIHVSKQPEMTAERSSTATSGTASSIAPSTARAMSFLEKRRHEILRELRNLSITWGIIILIFGAILTTINLS
jgi:hypothetical protein